MKQSVLILILILSVILATTSCKRKNYPNDIPKWLKKKIDKMEKEPSRTNCECRNVAEYTDGSSTFYYIKVAGNPSWYEVYNYPGTLICEYEGAIHSDCNLKYDQLPKVRTIWHE